MGRKITKIGRVKLYLGLLKDLIALISLRVEIKIKQYNLNRIIV